MCRFPTVTHAALTDRVDMCAAIDAWGRDPESVRAASAWLGRDGAWGGRSGLAGGGGLELALDGEQRRVCPAPSAQ